MAPAADAPAVDDGDDGRRAAGHEAHAVAADVRAGDGAAIAAAGVADLLDRIVAADQAGQDERLVDLQAASGGQLEDLAVGIAGALDADGERTRRAGLAATGIQHDLMDDKRTAVFRDGARAYAGTSIDATTAVERLDKIGNPGLGQIHLSGTSVAGVGTRYTLCRAAAAGAQNRLCKSGRWGYNKKETQRKGESRCLSNRSPGALRATITCSPY